jgi:RNA polymerase sigma-70 factor (ECF subfamily)
LSNHQISPAKRFEAILRPHFDVLYAAARRMTLSSTDAEDLVQDVCLKAFTRLDELERIEYQRAWLLKMMYHKFIDNQRTEKRSPSSNADTGQDSFEPDKLTRNDSQPEQLVDEEIRIARILMAMGRLDREHTALVALRDIEGLSITELQELTGMPAGTIKARLYRTRSKLGKILSNDATLKPHLKAIGGRS